MSKTKLGFKAKILVFEVKGGMISYMDSTPLHSELLMSPLIRECQEIYFMHVTLSHSR